MHYATLLTALSFGVGAHAWAQSGQGEWIAHNTGPIHGFPNGGSGVFPVEACTFFNTDRIVPVGHGCRYWTNGQGGIFHGRMSAAFLDSTRFELAGHEPKPLILREVSKIALPASEGYYKAEDAALTGGASLVNCGDNQCFATNKKIGNINGQASVTLNGVKSSTTGKKLIGIDFINYEYTFQTAWDFGSNTRNMTLRVNEQEAKRFAFPLRGNDWYESGRLMIELDGLGSGTENTINLSGAAQGSWAPDFVGLEVFS
ncbi:putative alpha-galactosidase D [Paramyrothecium foliicola]|nr:putative alpha-galactosidase D [Paramyrothecium foliicola]